MRRAVLTLGGTIAGLAALLSFRTHPVGSGLSSAGTPGTSVPTCGCPCEDGRSATGWYELAEA